MAPFQVPFDQIEQINFQPAIAFVLFDEVVALDRRMVFFPGSAVQRYRYEELSGSFCWSDGILKAFESKAVVKRWLRPFRTSPGSVLFSL
jgi:hypothetical protein